ncbi:unnamed protein product [Auanema sp. JU1783]|nr:unnamed protein product [Auanema sp. JU1783]
MATIEYLSESIVSLFPVLPNLTLSRAKTAIHPHKWLLSILTKDSAKKHAVLSAFASLSYYSAVSPKTFKLFSERLSRSAECFSEEFIKESLLSLFKEGVNAEKLLCLIVAFNIPALSSVFVEIYSKSCLITNTKPTQFVIDRCASFIPLLTVQVFENDLLPNVKKSLLRSPELTMSAIVCVLQNVSFPLDSYADDLVKNISSYLASTNEELMENAVEALVQLATSSSPAATQKIVNRLFDHITMAKSAEQRICYFNGIARCSLTKSPSSSELDKVANDIISKTAKTDKCTHEGTVSAQWEVAVAWANRLTETSPQLSNAFNEAPKLNIAVRSVGYRAIAKILSARNLTTLPADSEKVLWSELQNAQKEALDAIGLSTVLIKTSERESANLKNVWEKITKNDQLFKDKSLSSMNHKDGILWGELCERLILDRPVSENDFPVTVLQALTLLLFWPNWEVRKRASLALERIIKVEGAKFSIAFIKSMFSDIVKETLIQNLRKITEVKSKPEWTPPGEWYVLALRLILSTETGDLTDLAIHTLLFSAHPKLVVVDGSVWLRWIHDLDRNLWHSSKQFRDQILEVVLSCQERQIRDNALNSLFALNIPEIRNKLWDDIEKKLRSIEIDEYMQLTEKNVNIWKCPDGQLYNTEALEFDEGEMNHNTRRENKGLSHKEQVAEMQLRRELAEKKRKEGKLTAKQKQVMEKELASEKAVREEIDALYKSAEPILDLAKALVQADHAEAFHRSSILFDVCQPLTKTFLLTKEATRLFNAYRDVAFPESEDYLGDLLGNCWLKVNGSHTYDNTWISSDMDDSLKRCFSLLNERAFIVDTGDDDDDGDFEIFDEIVGAPQLTFLYPLVKTLLHGDFTDDLKEAVLTLLQNAFHRRFLKDDAVLELPMLEYADLLLGYYSKNLTPVCLKALTQVVSLANESEDYGPRVVALVQGALNYLLDFNPDVRGNVLKLLSAPNLLTRLVLESENETFAINCLNRIFIAKFDDVNEVSECAANLWLNSKFNLRPTMGLPLIDECVSPISFIRSSAAKAVFEYLEELPDETETVLQKLEDNYRDLFQVREAIYDEVGRMQRGSVDEWERRSGVGETLEFVARLVPENLAEKLVRIVAPMALTDTKTACRYAMTDAAVETIRRHGNYLLPTLLPYLEEMSDNTPSGAEHDNMREGLVVLLGTAAQFLEPSSVKVKAIVGRLLEVLNTPSQVVQESVSKCLSHLVPAIRDDYKKIVSKLQYLAMNAETYGERRGAAYGIGGLIKGAGLYSIDSTDLIPATFTAITDKKNWKSREGSLLILEILCTSCGVPAEPFMVKVLPNLLLCYGDNDENVRRAAEDTAKAMMSVMSRFGTKLILPMLTKALDDDSWRTKCAATELLGNMAFLAPKQLSSCLPSIVPKLIEVLADSSSKVQKSGEKALRNIARVIRNPEILGVTNHIMLGLLDPANKTSIALQAVLNTKFIHYIDAASLALLMPIAKRAFEDRNSETRRFAAQIIANIYNLTDHKDMEPYLTDLVPGLQKSILDPVPEIRSVAAKALGAIVSKSTGATNERLRTTIIPWLKDKLVCPQSTVDRSGAAQGLAEVLAGVGTDQLDYVMPEIIEATESTEVTAETRDGYILMYIYLPMVFKDKFLPYLPKVVPPILKALADENEYVRASALKAGQRLISQYCSQARRLLLPQLQVALCDDNWRIRYAAVQLIGDFLFNITGVTGKSSTATANEDDTMGMEQAGKTIVRALGQQCRDKVIAGLYLARSDVSLTVRQSAGHVWKIVVSNTPRTLKEVLKTLFEMVVDALASASEDRQQMGARCLGELVRKMGEKVISEILPVLEVNQNSEEVEKRVGVALALYEIIYNMSKDVLNHYLSNLVPSVRNCICDEEVEVRRAAASTFSVLYHTVGHAALDEIITPLLEQLTPEQDHILDGLCEVMKKNSRQMLPYLLPRLTKPPINAHALCSLAAVAGDTLSRQLPRVLDALLAACVNNDQYDPMIDRCEKVVIAVTDEEGVPVLAEYLLDKAAKGNVPAIVLFHTFVDKSGVDLSERAEELLIGLLHLYSSTNPQIVDHVIHAAIRIAQGVDLRDMINMLPSIKKTIRFIMSQSKGASIPGFMHSKAINPLSSILKEGVLQGGVEIKALAGETFSQIITVANEDALKPHVVGLTGPLIRVLGDRYPASVKLPMLECLTKLLSKVGSLLRPFIPQLLSTFIKSLQDTSSRPIRLAAAGALAQLINIHMKPEVVVNDLLTHISKSQDPMLTETTLVAARSLIAPAAKKLTPPIIELGLKGCSSIFNTAIENPSELDNSLTILSGALYGELALRADDPTAIEHILSEVASSSKLRSRQALAVALEQMSISDPAIVWEKYPSVRNALVSAFQADTSTASSSIKAAASFLISQGENPDKDLLSSFSKAINHQVVDVRKIAAIALGHVFAEREGNFKTEYLKTIVPQLVNGSKESNSAVRSASELALLYALNLKQGEEFFKKYADTLEGPAAGVLNECLPCLQRVIKNGDTHLEALHSILSV